MNTKEREDFDQWYADQMWGNEDFKQCLFEAWMGRAALRAIRRSTSSNTKKEIEMIGEASDKRDDMDEQIEALYGPIGNIGATIGVLNSRWWSDPVTGVDIRENPYCFSNKLMLIVSELSEAMEGDRKGLADTHLPHLPMRNVELADAAIRIFDLAHAYGIDLGEAIIEKLQYNRRREDHKRDARLKAGGKAY